HSEKRHCLITDRLLEAPVQFKHSVSSNLVKSVEAGDDLGKRQLFWSDMKLCTSTNVTETMAGYPPGGANSYRMVHRLGFFQEGRIPTMRNEIANTP
ncbi:MAG: hypothetical protein CL879_10895, partial [Dehalococcoidia bacterium]|nr:hypothetical protein [Dehalococcoidia bacterium]